MNNIVIELCKEDRQRLDEVIGFLGLIVGQKFSTPESALEEINKGIIPRPVNDPPIDTPAAHFDPPAPAPVMVSLGEFQKAIVTRCAESANTKMRVQDLIHKYADSVSNVPEDKRSEVLAALATI